MSDLNRNKEALNQIDQALKLDPISVFAGTLKGHFLYQARQYPQAIDQLLRTLELEPNFWVGQITLGKAYERAGRYDEALKAFREAGNLSDASSEPLSLCGYVYVVQEQRAQAEAALRQLQSISNSTEALRRLERGMRRGMSIWYSSARIRSGTHCDATLDSSIC